ncbi:MAG: type II toxin-antitoxin system VapC family toxin [Spirosomataceae bacterium]
MRYVFDTNILLHYLRGSEIAEWIDATFNPLASSNDAILSVVSIGEIRALAKINRWGKKRLNKIEQLCEELLITDINSEDVIERYAEIDAFSQGKLSERPLYASSRNMGKNDLWIAATASVLNATLLTTDLDFNHLHKEFLNLETIKI